jgi:hypothetical protein
MDKPAAYRGPYPILDHRTVAQVWAEQGTLLLPPSGNRSWCDQCERRVLPHEAAACTDTHCKVKERKAA